MLQDDTPILEELERARSAGIEAIVNVCTNAQELEMGLTLSSEIQAPKIYTACSTTPHEAHLEDAAFVKKIETLAFEKKLVAIGETGLDYHYEYAPKKVQQEVFRAYCDIAERTNCALVIHCREAFEDLFAILRDFTLAQGVMLHCFTGTLEEAKMALDRGYYISLSGIVTFKKSTELQEVARFIPDDRLLLETDAPYLAPQGFRGKKNEPAFLMRTLQYVAEMRNTAADTLAQTVVQNAKRLFKLIGYK